MPVTDTDHLSEPSDLVDVLRSLAAVLRDVEALPEVAIERFWDDTVNLLNAQPEDLAFDRPLSKSSVDVLYNVLKNMCGKTLADLVAGEISETMMAKMKEAMEESEWDVLLAQKAKEHASTDGVPAKMVTLDGIDKIGGGVLKRVDGAPRLLRLIDPISLQERYFSSKSLVMVEFEPVSK